MADADTLSAADQRRSHLQVAVVQDGARLHYAVPLALHRAGALSVMFSEAFFSSDSWLRRLLERSGASTHASMRGWLERRCDEISPQLVRTNLPLVIRQQWMRRRIRSDKAFYEWSSAAAGRWIRRQGYEGANALFGFVRNVDPMVLEDAHRRGLFTIADQFIAPALSEATEMTMQRERWPGWDAAKDLSDLSRVAQIEQRSWNSADCLTCASEYVRRELVSRGVEAARVAVNPYPIDASRYGVADRTDRKGVITIGFVGAVGLRKGAAYFLEVARRLASSATQFVMVGPVDLSATGQREMSTAVELTGRAARSDIATRLAEFDIFFFPSTCEGSAGCVMEAMASGLPVVTSPNSGTIIRDGIDGFVRNHDDVDGLAACLELLVRDVALRERMGRAARQAAETNNLARFGMRMLELMADRISKQTRYPSITPETASVAER